MEKTLTAKDENDFDLSCRSTPIWVWAAGLGTMLWSFFLAWRGHQPSFTGWPIPAERYYAVQAFFGIPLVASSFWILQKVLLLMAPAAVVDSGALQNARRTTLTASVGAAYGGCILLLYVSLDVLLYALGDFELLSFGVRFGMPLLALGSILAIAGVLRSRGYSASNALKSSALAVVSQGAWMGLFWR